MVVPGGGQPVLDEAVVEHPVLQRLRLEGSLGAQVRRGMAWTALTRVVLQVFTFGSQVVLARLLLPADYGLVALALVFNGFAALLTELGLNAAVVQSRRLTDRLLTTAFWLNALSGVVVTGAILALAPLVGAFYDDPRVVPLVQVSSLAFVLNVASVPGALLQRAMRFRTTGTQDVTSTVLGIAVTLAMAFAGAGALSLVVGPLVQVVAKNVMLWTTVRWWPKGFAHRAELRELWRFGGGLTGANLLYFVSRNTDTVLLGRFVSAGDLGLYSRSYTLMMMPLTQVGSVLVKVLLPAYAEMQDDLPRLRRAWTTTVRTSLLLGLPIGLGVATTAPALVETFYGQRWLGMVPTLVLLSASVPPQLVGRNLGPLFQAKGRTGLQFKLAIISTVVTVVAVVAGLPWGIFGVALALLVKGWFSVLIPLVPAMRLVQMPASQLWRGVRGLLLAALVMVAASLGAGWVSSTAAAPLVLLAQTAAGGVGYLGVMWLVERELVRATVERLRQRRRARRA